MKDSTSPGDSTSSDKTAGLINRRNALITIAGAALNEIFPESTYGAIPVIDQHDALEAYLAYDDGALAEAPQALAAYIDHQQHFAI